MTKRKNQCLSNIDESRTRGLDLPSRVSQMFRFILDIELCAQSLDILDKTIELDVRLHKRQRTGFSGREGKHPVSLCQIFMKGRVAK